MSHALTEPGTPTPKAASLVAAHIRKQIVMGDLAEGDSLPSEAVMLKQLSVSRPTLRQAFRILEAEHLITVQRGSRGGTTVLSPSIKLASRYLSDLLRFRGATLGDVLQARLMIEPAAVARLARRHDEDAVAILRELVAEQKSAKTGREQNKSADQFHVRLVELAGNSTLAQYCQLLHYLIRGHVRRYESANRGDDTGLRHGSADAHDRLVELVAAGAVHAASNHWRQHLEEVRDQLAERLDLNSELEPQS
jgi:DNA-binding FadR family transcriptional regulator